MTRGAFTLSLDCEGLWGMADQARVISNRVICAASLGAAYRLIAEALDRHGLRATCAFVSAFAAKPAVLLDNLRILRDLASESPAWFQHVVPALERGEYDGWFGHEFHEALRSAGHEMAWHGGTHLPLSVETPAPAVELELKLTRLLLTALGDRPETIVFPRNLVGQLPRLRDAGFRTYRAGSAHGKVAKAARLMSEWNVWDDRVGTLPYLKDCWLVSPPGFFLNWPKGVRRLVPVQVTVARWKSLLHHAAAKGGYVHMWFHPHNLITAPAMGVAFEQVLAEVGRLVRSGDLANVTMAEAHSHFGQAEYEGLMQ
jgi:peptidoglycan/xylan/chitin deacetylase (PgdA/CDA1 family)